MRRLHAGPGSWTRARAGDAGGAPWRAAATGRKQPRIGASDARARAAALASPRAWAYFHRRTHSPGVTLIRALAFPNTALLALAGTLLSTPDLNAQANSVHSHIGYVADAFDGTPNGQGLLPTAVAEAEIAAEHAGFAAGDATYLDGIKRHAGHVLHAIDPTLAPGGPGLGYGVRQAAATVVLHIELAAADEGASDNVKTHAAHILATMDNVGQRADAIVALAQEIEAATSLATAAALLEQLTAPCAALLSGRDADRDGRVGWQPGEGGLRQATQHMTLMRRGEGLIGR